MCGIAGIIALEDELIPADNNIIQKMTLLLHHRGPYNVGYFKDQKVHFGNTRLAILDLNARSNLPMISYDEDIIICYNGEISNYIELKNKYQLEKKYPFKGTSDTEVIIYLYKELGISFLQELSGMFSFSLYDRKNKKVFLAKDAFGINPHFYTFHKNKLYFASELKSLIQVPELDLSLNQQGIYDFFTLAYIPGIQTPYNGISELRNGEVMEIDLATGDYHLSYHYRAKYEINHDVTEKEASDKVYELLLKSVERNLRSDASIGTTLSGGVDTSSITCLIRDLGKSHNFHTFSIKMGEHSFDESHYQRLVAKECGTNHHEILVNPEQVIESFYQSIAYLDEPNGNGATMPSYILAKEAKKYVDVLLSGEGGDEVFNAYSIYTAWKIKKLYTTYCPKMLRQSLHWLAHRLPSNYEKLSFDFKAKRFTEGAELHPAAAHIYWRHPFTNSEKNSFLKFKDQTRSTDERLIKLYNDYKNSDELNRISMLDIEHFLVDDLLVKNDRMFLAHSVESRFPFLDKDLFNYTQSLPTHYKLKGFKGRHIEKMAMKRSLPAAILKRKNYGLEMPHSIWFLDAFKPFLEKYINKKTIEKIGFLNCQSINEMWLNHKAKKRDYGRG